MVAEASWPPGPLSPLVTPQEQGDVGTHRRARVGCPSLDPTFVPFELFTSMGDDPSPGLWDVPALRALAADPHSPLGTPFPSPSLL